MRGALLFGFVVALFGSVCLAQTTQAYNWKNVKIGGGGGFVPGIVFNPSQKNLAYARTDIGGAYRLNPDGTWSPLLDFVDDARWNYWGVDALATDPVEPKRLYLATGMYTNSWDPNNGQIMASVDYGATWTVSPLPFKVGGNMPGRGMGERLAVDPNRNSILYFGARSGNGLWKSLDYGKTWNKVMSFTNVGTYAPDPGDGSGYKSDSIGIAWVTFDQTTGTRGSATPRIFVGVASVGKDNIFVSENAGTTWGSVPGFDNAFIAHKGVIDPNIKVLYISANNNVGPLDGSNGAVWKYDLTTEKVTDITPPPRILGSQCYGFGGLAVDYQKPGTLMVAALNTWWPGGNVFRSTDGGVTWTTLWDWNEPWVSTKKFYTFNDAAAPWLSPDYAVTAFDLKNIGWMMEALVIDPFDSNRWMYGTGVTIQGGRDLLEWDTTHNITLQSMADGIEETAVLGLISPPTGARLISAVEDIGGFIHNNLTTPVSTRFSNPTWSSTADLDFAGARPNVVVRIGTDTGGSSKQLALSNDSGVTWSPHPGAPTGLAGGKVTISADGTSVLWRTGTGRILVSGTTAAFTDVGSLPGWSVIAADKKDASIFYGALGSSFYISRNAGRTFSSSGTLGSSASPYKIAVHPTIAGDVWVSTNTGLFHSTNFGATFKAIPNVSQGWAIALGAPSGPDRYPTIFAIAKVSGKGGIYRSDDAGTSWMKISDAQHGFSNYNSVTLAADPRQYGRVYVGTTGRGIFYGAKKVLQSWELGLDEIVVNVDPDARVITPAIASTAHTTATMGEPKRPDPILLTLFANRFMSVAEAMGRSLQQTSISTNIKERLDFSCALFGPDGDLVANAPFIPIHLGAMSFAVKYQMRLHAGTLKARDVLMSNSPQAGGSHLPDITIITPVFDTDTSEIIFFTASRGHHADIGGILPGSMPPTSTTIFEEGANVESFKIVDDGTFDKKGLDRYMIEIPASYPGSSGCRNIRDVESDLKAQIAANHKGVQLIHAIIDDYGLEKVQEYMFHIRSNAETSVRNLLRQVVQKTGKNVLHAIDYLDDGSPIELKIDIDEKEGSAIMDFTGTGCEIRGNLNAPESVVHSAIIYCMRSMLDTDIPLNAGCLVPLKINIPQGSLLSPSKTAAVCGGNVLTSQRIVDVVLKAFHACAASQGCTNNLTFGVGGKDKDGKTTAGWGYYETIAGGSGAGPGWHGTSGVHTHITNTRIGDVEILERRYPIMLHRFGIRPGSGGRGRWKGGDGLIREIEVLQPLQVSMLSERRARQPYGVDGGEPGALGRNTWVKKARKEDGDHQEGVRGEPEPRKINIGGKATILMGKGDRLLIETPGAGAWGHNLDPEHLDDPEDLSPLKAWEPRGSLRSKSQPEFGGF